MKIDEIRAILEKYQQSDCSPEERRAIEEWYDSLRLGDEEPLEQEVQCASLATIRGKLQEFTRTDIRPVSGQYPVGPTPEKETPKALPANPEKKGVRVVDIFQWGRKARITACAATVILFCGSAWFFFRPVGRMNTPLAERNNSDTTVITNRGETKQIVLKDGSAIQLNSGTEIRYPKIFAGSLRAVELVRGEAFFQVTGDPGSPFTVTVGKWKTTVLGTSFDIRFYGQKSTAQIALLTGKVRVEGRSGSQAVTLVPNHLLQIDTATGKMVEDKFENSWDVAAWKEGALHFKDASFEEIAIEIGNKYNINLINKSDRKRWSYTGLFRNGSLQEVIETICQTENLSYLFTEDGMLIINKK